MHTIACATKRYYGQCYQFAVTDEISADLESKIYRTGRPAFFYRLGDLVYYLGQASDYYDQFYDPYRSYQGPIFAIPGSAREWFCMDVSYKTAGILPDAVLLRHAHLYERYTRFVGSTQIPFVVAGMGGHFNLRFQPIEERTKTKPPATTKDAVGNKSFVTVTQNPKTPPTVSTGDSFTLDLNRHVARVSA